MKKLYFLLSFLFISLVGVAQNVTITKVIETGCASPFVKSVELYVDGTVDFSTDVVLNYMQNAAPWSENQIDITGLGTITDSFVYIVRDIALMQAEFPGATFDTSNTVVVGTGTSGDDGYQVVLNGTIVSQFGKTETDADADTESDWNHNDAVATRKDGMPDLGTWDRDHWDITAENDLDAHTSCQNSATTNLETYFVTLGSTYSLGLGSGWTPTAATCTAAIARTSADCNTTTAGATDDTYTATIDFTGGNTGKTFVINTTSGTVGGDNPTSVETGTITISDIVEGTAITVSLNDTADGGVCELSQDIESPSCIPLLINEVLFDPAGDDSATADVIEGDANGDGARDSAQDEFIELYNNSDAPLDISGYTISDDSELRHIFPAATIIPANEFLVVFGGGTPNTVAGYFGTAIVQIASEGADPELNLNNSGDIITIRSAASAIALVYDSASTGIDHTEDQSVTRSPDITGDFTLHTSANASLMFSPGLKIDGSPLSIDKNNLNTIGMYPNPVSKSTQYINIESNSSLPINITIYSIVGRQIDKQIITNNLVNVSQLQAGVYLMKISQGERTVSKKVVKQ